MASAPSAAAARVGGGRPFALLIGTLSCAAWLALLLWSASPYARYVEHDGWASQGLVGALCAAVPQGGVVVPALMHALAWVLMIAAMMLPTTLPLLSRFARVVGHRPDASRLTARVVLGFFAAWLAFGLIAHAADALLRALVAQSGWVQARAWVVGAAILAGAGLFQFSALKYRCLDQCRTPVGFIAAHWGRRSPARDAFRLGIDHGLFCVGCCWALMLVMFAVGAGSIGWMLALALAMAVEKNVSFGRRLAPWVGCALIAAATLVVARNL
jgi:predicted metal-binding membrane protein